MYFRFEKREPKSVEYKTLADVPEGVRCVCVDMSQPHSINRQIVRVRTGGNAYATDSTSGCPAIACQLIQVLDPIPSPPLPRTLADCDDGRCVMLVSYNCKYFRQGSSFHVWDDDTGSVTESGSFRYGAVESLTDIWAVRCEVE